MPKVGIRRGMAQLSQEEYHWIEEAENAVREATATQIFLWLDKHCQGYHSGHHGGEFGHFGIYRKELTKFKARYIKC